MAFEYTGILNAYQQSVIDAWLRNRSASITIPCGKGARHVILAIADVLGKQTLVRVSSRAEAAEWTEFLATFSGSCTRFSVGKYDAAADVVVLPRTIVLLSEQHTFGLVISYNCVCVSDLIGDGVIALHVGHP